MSDEFDAFLSYNWFSKETVKKIDENLMQKGLKIWRDERELKNNDQPLTEQLGKFTIYFIHIYFYYKSLQVYIGYVA